MSDRVNNMASLAAGILCALYFATLVFGDHVSEMKIAAKGPGFSFKNCNKSAPFNIRELSVTPDPVKPGSNVYVTFTVVVTQDIGIKAVKADMDAKLITGGQTIDVCDYFTGCHPADLCSIYKDPKLCPAEIAKLIPGCKCPLKKNKYVVNKMPIPFPSEPVSGELVVHITATESNQQVACLDLTMFVGSEEESINVMKLPGGYKP